MDDEVAVDPSAAYGIAIERFVALGLLLVGDLDESGIYAFAQISLITNRLGERSGAGMGG